jgi:hypothetical protein
MSEINEVLTPDQSQSGKLFDNYSSVDVVVKEATGIVFLGVLALILLILYVRSNQRNQELIAQINRRYPGG